MNVPVNFVVDMDISKFFETEVLPQLTGFARLIRYADDFVVCFEKEEEAIAFGVALRRRMGEFGLTISEEKSKIIEFGRCACTRAKQYGRKCETFDFLGFTHFCDKSRWDNFKLGRKTSRKKFRQKMTDMNIYHQVVRLSFKWVNRRSQRKSYNWARFLRFILFNPLPKPKIYHSLYNLNP